MKGVITALVTPFTKKDTVDLELLSKLLQKQIDANIDGIVLLGSTGESPTIEEDERKEIFAHAKEKVGTKTKLIFGTSGNSTKYAIRRAQEAEKLGADALLVTTPYYNKPTQEGIFLHFEAIANAVSIPIIVYNVPSRTGQNIETSTLFRLKDVKNIQGVKEASGNILQIQDVIEKVSRVKHDFCVFSGDDMLFLNVMALGGDGVISVISNVFPSHMKKLYEALNNADFQKAQNLFFEIKPFIEAAFIETNPIPIKSMLEHLGLPVGRCRAPLCTLSLCNEEKIKKVMEKTLS